MGMGQTMIAAAFFMLLIMSAISINRMLIENSQQTYKTAAYDEAITIAHDLVVEASRKRYDENNVTGAVKTSAFTSNDNLGSDGAGEKISTLPDPSPFLSPTKYDDFDDYNGYSRTVDGRVIRGFTVSVEVFYVPVNNPNGKTTSRTYMKRIDVKVKQPTYLDSVMISRIVTY